MLSVKEAMPTAYCNLNDIYGDTWNSSPDPNRRQLSTPTPLQQQVPRQQVPQQQKKDINVEFEPITDIKSFCPNCNDCLKRNDEFQQKVIDQTIWPRPQWVPQPPQAYDQFNPYNRYWTQTTGIQSREDFGNSNGSANNSYNIELLLKIIIFILTIMFMVQLVDIILKVKTLPTNK